MNYGYIHTEPSETDFIFGGGNLGDAPINPSGQWDDYLPPDNIQNRDGFEPDCCVTEATLNCVKTLLNQEGIGSIPFAVRFLAAISGTGAFHGNNPGTVGEALRLKGCCDEEAYPFTAPDYDTFYQTIPENVQQVAIATFAPYAFGHEWVTNPTPANLMSALTFSPLAVGVYAWEQDANGLYYRPQGAVSEHCVEVYGYEEGQYWKIFDSYDATHKRLEWGFTFDGVKRYTIHRQLASTPQAQTAWQQFVTLIHQITGLWAT